MSSRTMHGDAPASKRPKLQRLRSIGAGALALSIATSGLVAGVTPAAADIGPNPHTDVIVQKTFDGTGHGTQDATYVNTANGFVPGDDTATDGVVSSHDVVGYDVTLLIRAGLARTVSVTMTGSELLDWKVGKAEFCAPAPGITAQVVGETCQFTIKQGATAQLTRQVQMTALDTQGLAVDGQRLAVEVGLAGQNPYATVESAPVTVVSAPKADLVVHGNSLYTWSANENAGTGSFSLKVLALRPTGFSPTKGVSTEGAWQATVDVSEFPDGTTWKLEDTDIPVSDGKLSITGSGDQTLTFRMPGGTWLAMDEGTTATYGIGLAVPSTAFATEDYLNNGDGWQPGTGISRETSTYDAEIGSIRGDFFPNNDYSAILVHRPVVVQGAIFSKLVQVPYTPSDTLFESGNVVFADASSSESSYPARLRSRAPGTEFNAVLSLLSQNIVSGGIAVIADTWDAAQSQAIGQVAVTVDGATVDPASYTVQWASGKANDASLSDPASNDGWVTTAGPVPGANAVRVVFNDGVVQPSTGTYQVVVPMQVVADYPQTADPVVRDTLQGRVTGASGSVPGALRVVHPVIPTVGVTQTVDKESANPGDTLSYTVTPTVTDPPALKSGFQSTIIVQLDRCEVEPVSTAGAWEMAVTPAVPGPSGRVCGDPESVPAQLVFTPAGGGTVAHQRWNNSKQHATLPQVTYTARTTLSAQDTVATTAVHELAGMGEVVPASASSQTAMLEQSVSAAHIEAKQVKVEIDDSMSWDISLVQNIQNGTASTVIALPRNGDGVLWDNAIDPDGMYPGAKASDFQGSYTVTGVSTNGDDTSPGVELWFTVDAAYSLDPNVGTWHKVSEAGTGSVPPLSGATALKAVAAGLEDSGATTALVTVTLQPESNAEDDVYVMWVGETEVSGPGHGATMPWPAQTKVVSSKITGTLFWDEDRSASIAAGDPRIEGVTLGLFAVDADGVPGSTSIATTVTANDGTYEFTGLRAGNYIVRVVDRGPNLPDSAVTYYNESIDVETTYSFAGQRYARASESSTRISLGVDATRKLVDFGYFQADPKVDVDKTTEQVTCKDGICEVVWTVTIENLGNSDISAGTFTDTVSSDLYDVEAFFGEFTPGNEVVQLEARDSGGTALMQDGTVYSWGQGIVGQNGNGGTGNNLYAAPVLTAADTPLTGVAEIATRTNGGTALMQDGTVYSWGHGTVGQNGNGGTTDNTYAAPVLTAADTPLTGVAEIAARHSGGTALRQDGTVYSWGVGGGSGANGNGGTTDNLYAAPVLTAADTPLTGVAEIVARTNGGTALMQDGTVYSWGQGMYGQNGDGSTGNNLYAAPVLTAAGTPLTGVAEIAARHSGGTALMADGQVYSWGAGNSGANGDGSSDNNLYAAPVLTAAGTPLTGATAIAVRNYGGTALMQDGTVYSWGLGSNGQNGNGSTATNLYAAPVLTAADTPLTGVAEIVARTYGGTALMQDGTVHSWGQGSYGENGNGAAGNNLYAAPVLTAADTPLTGVAEIAARAQGGTALMQDGTVYSWGLGDYGQNGDGSGGYRRYAAPVLTAADTPLGTPAQIDASSAVPPLSTTMENGFASRDYSVPLIPVGETVSVVYRGFINQSGGEAPQIIVNQAWFTSPTTPIAGLLPDGQSTPDLPQNPGVNFNPDGIAGNATCNTDADQPNGQGVADSCDQVPVMIPVVLPSFSPGELSGLVWLDVNGNGVKDAGEPEVPGVAAHLFNGQNELRGTQTTGADGSYLFANVPVGDGYYVVFSIADMEPTPEQLALFGLDSGSFGVTSEGDRSATTSWTNQTTFTTGSVDVAAGAHEEWLNAGLVLANAGLDVVKTSAAGDPASLDVDADGNAADVTVDLSFTNTGSEPLTGFAWVDETLDGPELTDLACAADAATLVLQPGDTVTCAATLTGLSLANPAHSDRFTVTATGTITGTPVEGSDDWSAVADGEPGWSLSKTSDPETGSYVGAGSEITYTVTATNTGDLTLRDLEVFDDMRHVLNHSELVGDLPDGVQRTGTTLMWTIDELAPGAAAAIQYTVKVNGDAWAQTLMNSVSAGGDVPPDTCTATAPCETEHHTPPWPGALPLPVLGNVAFLVFVLLGIGALGLGAWASCGRGARMGSEAARVTNQ